MCERGDDYRENRSLTQKITQKISTTNKGKNQDQKKTSKTIQNKRDTKK